MEWYDLEDDEDCVMTVEEFRQRVRDGLFIDYDGFALPWTPGTESDYANRIYPSEVDSIPSSVTHIIWYNR